MKSHLLALLLCLSPLLCCWAQERGTIRVAPQEEGQEEAPMRPRRDRPLPLRPLPKAAVVEVIEELMSTYKMPVATFLSTVPPLDGEAPMPIGSEAFRFFTDVSALNYIAARYGPTSLYNLISDRQILLPGTNKFFYGPTDYPIFRLYSYFLSKQGRQGGGFWPRIPVSIER